MDAARPKVIVLAGPNGAGKSTLARRIFAPELGAPHYVNADTIAQGLSAHQPETVAFEAGRIMLEHLKNQAHHQESFAFETTLATKSFAPWIQGLKQRGYEFELFFLWLPDAEMAVQRVEERARHGGHFVPAETVRRRYQRCVANFFALYQPLADVWKFRNNANPDDLVLLAEGHGTIETVYEGTTWERIRREARR